MTTRMFTKSQCLICVVVMVVLPGCASRTQHVAVPTVVATQPHPEQDGMKKQFVATVQALPPVQRPQYIQQHPDLAQMVMQDPDPKVSGALQHLMPFKK